MLRSRRRREAESIELESAGESLWTESLDSRTVTRLNEVWRQLEEQEYRRTGHYKASGEIATTLRVQGGWQVSDAVLSGALKSTEHQALDLSLDILEAFIQAYAERLPDIDDYINIILREHRIGYRVVEHQVLDRGSDELHASVVEPALRLLVVSKFQRAHDAYLDALKEITDGKPGDAVTDAGTALQEMLTALGCSGNALGPLIEDAVRKGFLVAHDKKLADWVSADRSTTGDTHHHSVATEADAWLTVHVVGALIVRLADPSRTRAAR